MANPTVQTLMASGLSKSFAYHVVNRKRAISPALALWLFENDGLKVGPLDGKTPSEIRMLRRLYEPLAPASVVARRIAANDADQSKAAA